MEMFARPISDLEIEVIENNASQERNTVVKSPMVTSDPP